MKIEITKEGFSINGNTFTFPLHSSALTEKLEGSVFDEAVAGDNDTYIWHELGIEVVTSKTDGMAGEIRVKLTETTEFVDADACFNGDFIIDGKNYLDYFEFNENDRFLKDKPLETIRVVAMIDNDNHQISSILFYQKKEEKKKSKSGKKYKFKKAKNPVEFSDFNFKLLVIDELMYNQEVLEPKFDVREFAEEYTERAIDIEKEGYEPIPEVIEYFKNLQIEKKLLKDIEELRQDGNTVYLQVCPFWDGEDEQFNIESFDDVKHLPNLETITVFDIHPDEEDKLTEKGIEVDYL